MSTTTTNYNIVLPEGNDTFNPLVYENDAFTLLDSALKGVDDSAITTATHVLSGSVNALTRSKANRSLIVFVATADYLASQAFTVDGTAVVFRDADATTPRDGAFKTNQAVVCYLNGSILDMVSAGGVNSIIGSTDISAIGDGSITGAVDTLNTAIAALQSQSLISSTAGDTYYEQLQELLPTAAALSSQDKRHLSLTDSNNNVYNLQSINPIRFSLSYSNTSGTISYLYNINLTAGTVSISQFNSDGTFSITDVSSRTYSGSFTLRLN